MEMLRQKLLDGGASLVGFAALRDHMVSVPEEDAALAEELRQYPRAVALAIALPRDIVAALTAGPTPAYWETYVEVNHRLDRLMDDCAEILRAEGHSAHAQTAANNRIFSDNRTILPHKTVAVSAGLGWIGRSALLITPRYGAAVRLGSVLTDAPLPVCPTPLENRCGGCTACRAACPAGAITGERWRVDKDRDWIYRAEACKEKARELSQKQLGADRSLCGRCITACPHTKAYLCRPGP